jgi:hypothetical protein
MGRLCFDALLTVVTGLVGLSAKAEAAMSLSPSRSTF